WPLTQYFSNWSRHRESRQNQLAMSSEPTTPPAPPRDLPKSCRAGRLAARHHTDSQASAGLCGHYRRGRLRYCVPATSDGQKRQPQGADAAQFPLRPGIGVGGWQPVLLGTPYRLNAAPFWPAARWHWRELLAPASGSLRAAYGKGAGNLRRRLRQY